MNSSLMAGALPAGRPDFTPQQREAIQNLSDNLLILAPAGTGKTNTIAHRIIHILDTGAALPAQILCLSFTNRACREMVERVEQVVGTRGREVTVKTIHSFCYQLLREYGALGGEDYRDTVIFDDEDCRELLRELLPPLAPGADFSMTALCNVVEFAKRKLAQESFLGWDKMIPALFDRFPRELGELCTGRDFLPDPLMREFFRARGGALLEEYTARLGQNRGLDFSDLVLEAARLCALPAVAASLRERYRFIHVDEVQDVSRWEYDLALRVGEGARLLLCGDIHQTIYQWRGSAPMEILRLYSQDKQAKIIRFTQNFRSAKGLYELSRRYLSRAFPTKETPSADPCPAPPELERRSFPDPESQAEYLYNAILALPVEGDYSQVAVLGRSNAVCESVSRSFERLRKARDGGFSFLLADEFKLFRRREIKDILAFIRVIVNPRDSAALQRILEQYSAGVGQATLRGILEEAGPSGGVALWDFLDPLTETEGDLFAPLSGALHAGEVVVLDVESTGVDPSRDRIVQIAAIVVGRDGKPLRSFERFINPMVPVGDSAAVHGFSDDFLRGHGKPVREVLAEFLEFAGDRVTAGHNVGYDLAILHSECRRNGLSPFAPAAVYDTLDIARRYLRGVENHKLGTLCAYLQTESRPTHNAMDDILATAQLLIKLWERCLLPAGEKRREIYQAYLPRFLRAREGIARMRRQAGELDTASFLRRMVEEYKILWKYRAEPPRLENIEHFLLFAESCRLPPENRLENLRVLLEFSALSSGELDRLARDSKKLAIITVHQAKGCEFDYVFLPSLNDCVFPTWLALQKGDLEEEKRLFYVAMTRAKKKLWLTSTALNDKGRPAEPSRLLSFL